MAISLVNSAQGDEVDSQSASSCSVDLTGVTAGNLIVLWVRNEVVQNATASASDGTSSFEAGTKKVEGYAVGQFFYLLSANSGDRTYTVSFSANVEYPQVAVWECSYPGTISLDAQNVGGDTSAAPISGVITTTGTDEIVFGGHVSYYPAGTISNRLINGEAADGNLPGSGWFQGWYKLFSAPFSDGAASLSQENERVWVCNIIAFKAGDPPSAALTGTATESITEADIV